MKEHPNGTPLDWSLLILGLALGAVGTIMVIRELGGWM